MSLNSSQIPFFPQHETVYFENKEIRITWFESKFSQCHYNYQNKTGASNACTLIAVLMASYCQDEDIIMTQPENQLNIRLIYLMAYSMLDGNKIHEMLRSKGCLNNYNLTVPEAMKYAGCRAEGMVEWKSLIFMEPLFKTLHINIRTHLAQWLKKSQCKKCNSDLYVILIADNKSVLFIFQPETNTVTLVDSHQHSENQGAFIAAAVIEKLNILCLWFNHVLNKNCKHDTDLYELSFLYFQPHETG